jgi:chemotaxis protein methyltransferase WspC
MKQIETLLRERIGLDPGSIGTQTIHRNVRLRINALGLPDLNTYTALLLQSSREWRMLTESVVVTETWFFRERDAFEAAARLARPGSTASQPGAIWRVLSLPCSTGEEPYSLAMSLLDAGLTPAQFRIDAIDLSQRALERARQGTYGPNSFRGKQLGYRDRHFRPSRDGYVLDKRVRDCVHFQHGNLIDQKCFPFKAAYDCIFCRNLLIYFDSPTRLTAARNLAALLKVDGVLFVGAAEMPLVEEHGFESTGIPLAFACRRPHPVHIAPPHDASRRFRTHQLSAATAAHSRIESPSLPEASVKAFQPLVSLPGGHERDLALARRLIESGRLAEATAVCEELLRRSRTSAQAYYLLGVIKDMAGSDDALEYYRKALYLQPGHYDGLLRMAALAAKTGRPDQARNFRLRARRAKLAHLRHP